MGRKRKKRYFNQQSVTAHYEFSHKKEEYFKLDKRKNNRAMRELSGIAYKLYIYLSQIGNKQTAFISGSDFLKQTGISTRSYAPAKQELIQKRYLILREDGDFDFYNYPYTQHHETVFEKLDRIKGGSANPIEEEDS